MKKTVFALLVTLGYWSNSGYALSIPQSYPSDNRITHVAYQENNVIPVKGRMHVSTLIIFHPQERILNIEGGDVAGWVVTHHETIPNVMYVKPTVLNSNANITVITNRRIYYFHTTSNKQLHTKDTPVYAIKLTYPEEERLQLKASLEAQKRHKAQLVKQHKNPKTYNWNYSFHGSNELKPLHVFDDGVFTYFELLPSQPIPAIFIVDNKKGEEAVSNIRRQGAYLVVHRTAPQFTLRMGKNHVASIFNNQEIARIKGRSTL